MKELELLFKAMSEGMKIMADGMNTIADQLNRLAEAQRPEVSESKPVKPKAAKQPAAKKATGKKKAAAKSHKAGTATDVVFKIIQDTNGGIDNKAIGEKTGFDPKKVTNALYRLKKEGKIVPVSRGVYKAA